MEDSEEYKWALKIVIKRQMRGLIEQLRENGEEIAIIAADVNGDSCSHFGSPNGDWFMSEQRNITSSFLSFCKNQEKKKQGNIQNYAENSFQSSSVELFDPDVKSRAHLKQKGSSKTLLKVWIPADLALGTTDEELAGTVGRIIVAKLSGSMEKGGSPQKTGTFGSKESVTTTRSGRSVRSSLKIAMNILDDSIAEDGTENRSDIKSHLTELNQLDLKRFEVCTVSGSTVDLQSVSLSTQQIELFEIPIVQAISKLNNCNKLEGSSNKVKIVVLRDNVGDTVHIDEEELIADNASNYLPENNASMELDMDVSDAEDIWEDSGDDFDYDPPKHLRAKKEKVEPAAITAVTGTPGKALSLRIGKQFEKLKKRKRKRKYVKAVPVECPHCGISLSGKTSLYSHINRVHLKLRNHKCAICSKGFYNASALENHMVTVHTRKCESCQEYLVESVPWEEGITHSTPREVTCQCGANVIIYSKIGAKGWKSREEIDMDGISEGKPKEKQKYACGVCGRLYVERKDCENHSLMHSSTKNFVCEVCGSRVKTKANLCKHRFKEHGIYSNKCEVCSKNFCSALALKIHVSQKHGKPTSGMHFDQAEVASKIEIGSEILASEILEN